MSISSTISRVDYIGNGAVDTYDYTFRILEETDLLVVVRDTNDVETELTLTTHYTVTGVQDVNGGTIVLVSGAFDWLDADGDLNTGYSLSIRRVRPLTQPTDIRNQGTYFPETHENAFDHQVMLAQQQQDEIDRSIKLPETAIAEDIDTFLPLPSAGLAIGWNSSADGLVNIASAGDLTVSSYIESFLDDADEATARATLGGISKVVATIAALKALSGTNLTGTVLVRGYTSDNDGGQGLFVWDGADSSSDNTGTIIAPIAGGTGRWHRLYSGWLNVKWFGAKGDGSTNDATAIAAAISAASSGSTVFFPNATYVITSTLTLAKTLTLQGEAGRDFFDNSWDGEGSSVIHCTANVTAIDWAAPNTGNSRIGVYIRDLCIRGGRVSNSRTAGYGISINGRQQGGTFARVLLHNVNVCEAAEEGLYMTGAIYGSDIKDCSFFSNGYSGIFVDGAGLTDPMGEMIWSQIRVFGNGSTGGSTQEDCGFFYHPVGSSNVLHMVSCSNNAGHGIILQGGSFVAHGLHLESNTGTIQCQIADGTSYGVTACSINSLFISPGTSYTGTLLKIEDNADNVTVNGYFIGDTLGVGGKDIVLDAGAGNCSFRNISGTHTLVVDDNSAEINYLDNVHFLATMSSAQTNVTGDGTTVDLIFNNEISDARANYDATTGIFTAPMAGLYDFAVSLAVVGIGAGHDRWLLTLTTTGRSYATRGLNANTVQEGTTGAIGIHSSWPRVLMAEGDTAKVQFSLSNGAKTVDTEASNTNCWFMGRMVTP